MSDTYFRQKAELCRRLAKSLSNQNDPVVGRLLAFAAEFEVLIEMNAADQETRNPTIRPN
jgi:hypothetical protein